MLDALAPYILPLVALLCVLVVVLAAFVAHLEMRLRRLTRGADGASLEGVVRKLVKDLEQSRAAEQSLGRAVNELRALAAKSPRGVSVVRFNALTGDTSGKQSFAAALVNERGDGVVISSLHARENARVYGKPVRNFESEFELTGEEKQAIVEARKQLA